ncbi:F-box-like protein [Ceratobasidium sp. AG-Ba]|nr:F-box-like protein [Ceratobasidium sp. AG-Ba]
MRDQVDEFLELHEAFRHWKSARTNLSCVIEDYENASRRLKDTMLSMASHPATLDTIQSTLAMIDSELPSLRSEEQQLAITRTDLSTESMKNYLCPNSLANRIPVEIWIWIFALCSRRCEHPIRGEEYEYESSVSPAVLASVCSIWRRAALESPHLWSHIDVIVCHDWTLFRPERATLWKQRSGNAPLQVHMSQYEEDREMIESQADSQADFWLHVGPLLRRANETRMVFNSEKLYGVFMAYWIDCGNPSIPKTLEVRSTGPFDTLIRASFRPRTYLTETMDLAFKSCYKFTLYRCLLSADSMFHEGLVELRLEMLIMPLFYLRLSVLTWMLQSCPRLQKLVLWDAVIEPRNENVSPVVLRDLRSLTLRFSHVETQNHLLLPCLTTGSDSIDMSVTISPFDSVDNYRAFFLRARFARLHIVAHSHSVPLSTVLCPIPDVQVLAIEKFDFTTPGSEDLITSHFHTSTTEPWPMLHTLELSRTHMPRSFIQGLQQVRSLRNIYAEGLSIPGLAAPGVDSGRENLWQQLPGVEVFDGRFGSKDNRFRGRTFGNQARPAWSSETCS